MTKKELVNRNIGLTFDFVHYLIDNPEEIDKLPDNCALEFIEKDFPQIEKIKEKQSESILLKKYIKVKNSFELID